MLRLLALAAAPALQILLLVIVGYAFRIDKPNRGDDGKGGDAC